MKRKRQSDPTIRGSTSTTCPGGQAAHRHISSNSADNLENEELSFEEESILSPDEPSIQPHYIGEAACTTFGSRLHQYLTADDNPPLPRRHHYYKNPKLDRLTSIECELPNRNYAQLLVRVVLRFMLALFRFGSLFCSNTDHPLAVLIII